MGEFLNLVPFARWAGLFEWLDRWSGRQFGGLLFYRTQLSLSDAVIAVHGIHSDR